MMPTIKLLVFPVAVMMITLINWRVKKDKKAKQQLLMGITIAVFLIIYNLVWNFAG
ncbi:hypothetical protein [Enterococcus sp. AZ109]|uniref:hypothetical protein n=1 Tax=Enterococcus sp. AZ109 TaxID=2774634 RepID=UPI003F687BAC